MKIAIELEAPPSTVDVVVDFYNLDEKRLFQKYLVARLAELPQQITIATPDLLAFYLYHRLQPGVKGYSTHSDVAEKWTHALVEFGGQIAFSKKSMYVEEHASVTNGITERLGEAIGLSVANWLHNLHQADWQRIAITNKHKTMDFSLVASDTEQFVQLETKGSIVSDNSISGQSTPHKQSIKNKKASVTEEERSRTIYYGTIASVDSRPDSVVRCWLVDPPSNVPGDPLQFRYLSRMTYIADLVSLVSPRSSFAIALQNRIQVLWNVDNPLSLDGIPLFRGDGTVYRFQDEYRFNRRYHSFFQSKSYIVGTKIGGEVCLNDDSTVTFIGFDSLLVDIAVEQDVELTIGYALPSKIVESDLACIVSENRFESERWSKYIPRAMAESVGGYVRFRIPFRAFVSASGLAFGWASIPNSWKTQVVSE